MRALVRRALPPLLLLLAACVRVDLPRPAAPERFALDELAPAAPAPAVAGGGAVEVEPVRAAPGLEGRGLLYRERPHEVRRYARSEWVEPPARMLGPLLAAALERSGLRVVGARQAGPRHRLETELVTLRHELLARPGQVRLALRVRLVGPEGRTRLERALETTEPAPTDDAYGAVVAANRAAARLLGEAAAACAEAIRSPGPPPAGRDGATPDPGARAP